jgi:hypothetical protein
MWTQNEGGGDYFIFQEMRRSIHNSPGILGSGVHVVAEREQACNIFCAIEYFLGSKEYKNVTCVS